MTHFFFNTLMTMLVVIASHHALAQTATPTATATASDVAALREQVQALTETVKALQQEVKDQQAVLERANITGDQLPHAGGAPSVASEATEGRAGARPSSENAAPSPSAP